MGPDHAVLESALEAGETEGGSIEFKEQLSRETHLVSGRKESLLAQLRHRVLSGDGKATYVLGVTDDGGLAGVSEAVLSETIDVLSVLADEADVTIEDVTTWSIEEGVVGVVELVDQPTESAEDEHLIVGTAGHVDHGKSTLVGTLVTGEADNGEGGTRSYLDVKPHEVERGLSADLSYGVYGFTGDEPLRVTDPTRKDDRAEVVAAADRLVSFVDTVGHEPWLRTTIRGLVGQKLDYGLLTVAADDGPTQTTREHLGVLLATELPTIVAITKTDLVDAETLAEVERDIERLLREADRTPLLVRRHGPEAAIEEIGSGVVPIVRTSAVDKTGLSVLDELFRRLPKTTDPAGTFRMYIDRTYSVTGVGPVASGTITSGTVEAGDSLLLGPAADGSFREVEVRSIEMHYHRVDKAKAGRIVGIALKGVTEAAIERGMVLVPRDSDPTPVREFEAEIMVLNHPTRIKDGYEPVVHLETISEAAAIYPDSGQLLPGDTGTARLRFKYQPHLIEPGQRFVFREGRSKGVGTVTAISPSE